MSDKCIVCLESTDFVGNFLHINEYLAFILIFKFDNFQFLWQQVMELILLIKRHLLKY